ncbi:MAG: hypothetical protein ACPIOQ_74425, partial [Promethearchaeia archaeon]
MRACPSAQSSTRGEDCNLMEIEFAQGPQGHHERQPRRVARLLRPPEVLVQPALQHVWSPPAMLHAWRCESRKTEADTRAARSRQQDSQARPAGARTCSLVERSAAMSAAVASPRSRCA